nr:BFH_HP1_G0048610.mRNA.1.CDS.1 [Saccharomyces cerevisiae]
MDNTIPYFESIVITVDSRFDKEEATKSRLNSLIDHWHDYERTHHNQGRPFLYAKSQRKFKFRI